MTIHATWDEKAEEGIVQATLGKRPFMIAPSSTIDRRSDLAFDLRANGEALQLSVVSEKGTKLLATRDVSDVFKGCKVKRCQVLPLLPPPSLLPHVPAARELPSRVSIRRSGLNHFGAPGMTMSHVRPKREGERCSGYIGTPRPRRGPRSPAGLVWEGVGRASGSGPGPPPGAAARADPPTTWISRACRV